MTYLTVINKSNNVYIVRQVVTIICNTRCRSAMHASTRRETSQLATPRDQFFGYDSARDAR